MNLFDELMAVARALDGAGVDYALVGGLAVGVWGAPRATQDIDLLVLPEDVARAKDAVRACGYTLEALPRLFSDGMQLQRVSKIVAGQLMTLDLILVDRNLEPAWQSRQRRETESATLSVVSRDALIAMSWPRVGLRTKRMSSSSRSRIGEHEPGHEPCGHHRSTQARERSERSGP